MGSGVGTILLREHFAVRLQSSFFSTKYITTYISLTPALLLVCLLDAQQLIVGAISLPCCAVHTPFGMLGLLNARWSLTLHWLLEQQFCRCLPGPAYDEHECLLRPPGATVLPVSSSASTRRARFTCFRRFIIVGRSMRSRVSAGHDYNLPTTIRGTLIDLIFSNFMVHQLQQPLTLQFTDHKAVIIKVEHQSQLDVLYVERVDDNA